MHPTFSVSRLRRLLISGSFDDANIPRSRYPGLITIAHTREDQADRMPLVNREGDTVIHAQEMHFIVQSRPG